MRISGISAAILHRSRCAWDSVEQQQATIAGDIARINIELDAIRDDVSRIERRLDLADA